MNVLVPFDVQPVSERAVRTALDMFGGDQEVHITAVHVSDREETPEQLAASEVEAMGSEHDASVEAEIQLVERGSESRATVRKAITDIVESRDIDLVILGYEEKSLFEQVFRSDTAERMLKTHGIPVLVVP